MTRAAVILSGCGFADGAEIRESVLALLALDQRGVAVDIYAPDISQRDVTDCMTNSEMPEQRNVLREAARIARGQIAPLVQCDPAKYDLLVIPGGFGVAKNLSDFVIQGANASLESSFARAIHGFYDVRKPIAAICIAPAVLAVALKGKGITVTIGEDAGVAAAIVATGNLHQVAASDQVVVDQEHRIATCSAYMRDDALTLIAKGIDACVDAAVQMAGASQKHAA